MRLSRTHQLIIDSMEATQVECKNKEAAAKVANNNTSTSTSQRNSSMMRLFLYYFNMPKACYLVEGVTISLTLVEYGVVSLFMSYLKDVFLYSTVRAATTVYIFYFVSGILAIFAELCKLRDGLYFMVQVNCISYILALVVLFTGLPAKGTTPSPKSEHGLHGALFLLAVGRGVYISTCTKDFLGTQMKKARRVSKEDNDERDDIRCEISTIRAKIVGFGLSNWILYQKWDVQFQITIGILSCTTFFLFAWKIASVMSYTTFSSIESPESEDDRSENRLEEGNTTTAALSSSNRQQSGIVKTSTLWSAAPICFTFLMYGVIHSTGETFFQDQAGESDTISMGNNKTSLMNLQIIAKTTRFFINHLVYRVLSGRTRTGTLATLIHMGLGMLFSVVTCSIAQYTEVVRLTALNPPSNVSLAGRKVDVTLFIPQFISLGFVTGLAGKGLEAFFGNEYSNWIKVYATTITEVLTGIGHLLNAILILMLKLSTTWFGEGLNMSRLDLYYHTIAVVCVLNFIPLYALASTCYYRKIKIRQFLLEGM